MVDPRRSAESVRAKLPLRPLEFSILVALAEEDLHGYGIAKRIGERDAGGVELAPGNLYGVLDRLLEAGLIEAKRKRGGSETRGRDYGLTEYGRRVASAEAERLRDVLQTARRLDLLSGRLAP
jgi:DNA-binding PadR family transcriptional regulator